MAWRIIGHKKSINILDKSLRENRLAHCYLLVGPPNIGKTTIALEIAQAVNCTETDKPCGECTQCLRIAEGKHSDVQLISLKNVTSEGQNKKNRTEISINDIREMQKSASLKPFEGACRVFIIKTVEQLSIEAANCLLKTLEEPPAQVIVILLSNTNSSNLLQTIVSRCQVIKLNTLPTSQVAQHIQKQSEINPEQLQQIANLSRGRIGWAIKVIEKPEILTIRQQTIQKILNVITGDLFTRFEYASELANIFARDRESVREELEMWISILRDILIIKQGSEEWVNNISELDTLKIHASKSNSIQLINDLKQVDKAWNQLIQNTNARLCLENLMLNIANFKNTPTKVTS